MMFPVTYYRLNFISPDGQLAAMVEYSDLNTQHSKLYAYVDRTFHDHAGRYAITERDPGCMQNSGDGIVFVILGGSVPRSPALQLAACSALNGTRDHERGRVYIGRDIRQWWRGITGIPF